MTKVLKFKVLWTPANSTVSTELSDITRIALKKGLDFNSNTVDVTLRNPIVSTDGTYNIRKHISDSHELKIKKSDVIEVFAKYTEVNEDIDTTSTDDLLTTADIMDIDVDFDKKRAYIKLSCIDKTFNLLNKVWSQNYGSGDEVTVPQVIQNIVRNVSDVSETRSHKGYNTSGVFLESMTEEMYEIDARLVSDGGFIQDTRPNSGGTYPKISMGKSFKPIYEWIEELSTTDFTNKEIEKTEDNLKCTLKHIYYIDRQNRFHWEYPNKDIDYTIVVGDNSTDALVQKCKLKNSVFDIVNTIFFTSGKGLNNETVLGYYYDSTSDEPKLKQKYIPWEDIAIEMKNAEKSLGHVTFNEDGTTNYPSSYPVTTNWGESVTSDSDYANKFFDEAEKKGKERAKKYTLKKGSARWKGTLTTFGQNYTAGEMVSLTAVPVGVKEIPVRIKNVTHSIDKNSWQSTLDLEEDEKELG